MTTHLAADDARARLSAGLRRMSHAAEADAPGTSTLAPWLYALAGQINRPGGERELDFWRRMALAFVGEDEAAEYTGELRTGGGR